MSSAQPNNKNKRKKLLYKLLLILVVLIGINILAYKWYTQIDLTQDKRYSTTQATKQMLQKLNGKVHVTVYLKNRNLPAAFKNLAISTEEILKTFNAQSGNNLTYEFVDPTEAEDALSTLEKYHMKSIPVKVSEDGGMSERLIFPWALVTYTPKDGAPRSAAVKLQESNSLALSRKILNRSEVMLEYNLGNAIFQLQKNSPDFVAYVLGNGEAMPPYVISMINNVGVAHFAMDTFTLQTSNSIPQKFKAIVINRPTVPFSETDLFKIDQYIMNGGRVLFAAEPTLASIDSFHVSETFMASPNDVGLNTLLFPYGVRVNSDMALDANANAGIPVSTGENSQPQLFPWPYFPILEGNEQLPLTKNLEGVMARFPGSIDLNKNNDAKVKKTPLLTTTIYGKTIGLPALVMYKSVMDEPNQSEYNKKNLIVAALLEGQFVSPFMQQQSSELQNFINQNNLVVKNQSANNAKMIVLSDADILLNEVRENGSPSEMGTYIYRPEIKFDNASFFQNCLTYLIDDNNLLQARTKTFQDRILDPKLIKEERTKWQILAIGLPLVLVGLLAMIYTYLRKRKYSK